MSNKNKDFKDLECYQLVRIVKKRGKVKKSEINAAYEELQERLKPKIGSLINQFYIPGCNCDDIFQEALYALRYKAIPDYRRYKESKGPYPFESFAILCIRRHLSTLLKSSFQHKKKTLNTSISLSQEQSNSDDNELFLINIVPNSNGITSENVEQNEYYRRLFNKLFENLSKLEKKIFLLYIRKYSYDEMTAIVNKNYKRNKKKTRINVKSVDNALSRIKIKANIIYKKYGD